jgi:hypothetical protein
MLSGPDLGAGYLHQLSIDRDGDRTTFTYHAQEGGVDAAGPPKGSLDVFGYVHPPQACQFGGPRCWHRRFLLPFAETAKVRTAYNRSRFVLQAMLDQAYAGVPADTAPAMRELVARLSAPLARARIPWYVGGSAGTWLLGDPVRPRDIDLGTTRTGVDQIADLLREYLIEPVGPTDWPRAGIVHAARAFVGTFQSGARVEWAVPLDLTTPPRAGEWGGRPEDVRTLPATFEGAPVLVTRPEYSLVRAWVRSDAARAAELLSLVRRLGPDRALVGELLEQSTLAPPARARRLAELDV